MTVTERTIDATTDHVYGVIVHPKTYPKWLVGAKRIREVSATWPAPGSWFEHTVGFGPLMIADRTTVEEVDDGHMLQMLVRVRPILEASVRFEIDAVADGCRIRMTETPVGAYRFAAPVIAPLMRLRNERSMNRLAEAIENARPLATRVSPTEATP